MNLHMTFDPLFQDLAFSLSLFLTSRDEASLHSGHISELVRIKEVHPFSRQTMQIFSQILNVFE